MRVGDVCCCGRQDACCGSACYDGVDDINTSLAKMLIGAMTRVMLAFVRIAKTGHCVEVSCVRQGGTAPIVVVAVCMKWLHGDCTAVVVIPRHARACGWGICGHMSMSLVRMFSLPSIGALVVWMVWQHGGCHATVLIDRHALASRGGTCNNINGPFAMAVQTFHRVANMHVHTIVCHSLQLLVELLKVVVVATKVNSNCIDAVMFVGIVFTLAFVSHCRGVPCDGHDMSGDKCSWLGAMGRS